MYLPQVIQTIRAVAATIAAQREDIIIPDSQPRDKDFQVLYRELDKLGYNIGGHLDIIEDLFARKLESEMAKRAHLQCEKLWRDLEKEIKNG